jgi:hypothetical protein
MRKPNARRYALRKLFLRLVRYLCVKGDTHGLPVWLLFYKESERKLILERLNSSLELLKSYAPARHSRVLRSLRGILVMGSGGVRADYDPLERTCRLAEGFVLDPRTTSVGIAGTLVHEATHGWLFDRGIGYDEPIRHRVEQICMQASLATLKRLPKAEDEMERCRRQLEMDPSEFSDAALLELGAQKLRDTGCPDWLVRAALWIKRKRAA